MRLCGMKESGKHGSSLPFSIRAQELALLLGHGAALDSQPFGRLRMELGVLRTWSWAGL